MEVMTRLSRKDDRVLCEIATKQQQGMPYLSLLYNIGLNPFGNSNSFKLTE